MDNSTGAPRYTYLDDKNYHPPLNRSKRGATANKDRLWPQGIVPCSLYDDLTGMAIMTIYIAGYCMYRDKTIHMLTLLCRNIWLAI